MDKFTRALDYQFNRLYLDWRAVAEAVPAELIYLRRSSESPIFSMRSCGEEIVRSAGIVEQTFGGLTTNLWDDPFEWTLPESLQTTARILEYLAEVETTRNRGFALFKTDDDLLKEIVAPSGSTQLLSLLMDTLIRAGHHQANARELSRQIQAGRPGTNALFAGEL